jgi:guanylate kinase
MSRSYTSRGVRPGEADGVDYNFVSRDVFEAGIAAGRFLEWADVFGNYYGTAREDTEQALDAGDDLVLVIDVQGARQVRAAGLPSTTVFVLPSSADILEQRLRGRSRDTAEQVRRRLDTARAEVDDVAAYDYVVVNDDLEHAAGRLKSIVLAERARTPRMQATAAAIVQTFRV